jgi:hypothetical protein
MLATSMAVALVAAFAVPAHAQQEGGGPGWSSFGAPTFVGRTTNMGPNCPAIEFRVIPGAKNQLSGVAIEQALGANGTSSVKLYTIAGTLADDGKLAMDLKPVAEGTPIKVEGTFKQAMLMASIAGRGTCHSSSFMLMPVVMFSPAPAGGRG